MAGGVLRRSCGDGPLSHGFAVPAPPEGKPRALRPVLAPRIYEGGGPRSGRGSSPAAAGTALSVALRAPALPRGEPRELRSVPAPRIYEGGGPRSGRGSSPAAAGTALSVALRAPALPRGEPRGLRPVLAPRIYEGGGPRSGRGSLSAAAGTALSVTAAPCQLSQRESQVGCAPFLPPAFMRGEGHAVAGGVLRRSGGNPLSHGFAVPALPKGKPRELRTVLAPRIYEGGGPRSGRGSPPPLNSHPNFSHSKSIKICIFPIYELKIML